MISSSHSDMASLLNRTARLNDVRSDARSAQNELLSGRLEKLASQGGATTARVQRISLDLARMEGDRQSLSLIHAELQGESVEILHIGEQVSALTTDLLRTGYEPSSSARRAVDARQGLEEISDMLGQSGKWHSSREVDVGAMLADLESALTAAADPNAALDLYFQRGGAFDISFPTGAPPPAPILSDGSSPARIVELDTDGLRDAIAGLAALALAGTLSGEGLSDHGTARLLRGQDGLIAVQTEFGTQSARVENSQTAASVRAAALGAERNALDGVDPYEAATRLQAEQSRVETVLLLTRRMSELTLSRYL